MAEKFERTFIAIKPDAVNRGCVGEIISRFEKKGFKLLAMKLLQPTKEIAAILKKSVRLSDIVARYGGEEMAIILPNTNLEDAITTANKICKTVSDTQFHLLGGIETNVTISLGVSTYPMHGNKPEDLIKASDMGLYNAKENGRNQVGKIQDFVSEKNENVDE